MYKTYYCPRCLNYFYEYIKRKVYYGTGYTVECPYCHYKIKMVVYIGEQKNGS